MSDQTNSQTVNTNICAVTVYTDQALVTRRGKVALTGREQNLVVVGLPVTLETESVRATGAGSVSVRLLEVKTARIFATEPVSERLAQITQQIVELEERQTAIQDQLATLQLQRNFIQGLSDKYLARLAKLQTSEKINLDEIKQLLNFVGQQHSEYASAIAQRERQKHKIDKQLEVLRKQRQQLHTPLPKESFNIIVTIAASSVGDFELEVSYIVYAASWTPLYDLRVLASDRLYLSYLASVEQSTGEDWNNVALTLSTAKPGLGTLPPQLEPWYIDIVHPMAAKRQRHITQSYASAPTRIPLAEAEFEEFDMSVAPTGGAMVVAETGAVDVNTTVGVVTFQLNWGGNIPSDGAPHKITIFNDDYPCSLQYVAMPRLVSFAYLEAIATNSPTGATLLPGTANIFRDNTFVGTTQLANIPPGQEFNLNLGIDEGLKIQRDLVERNVDKRIIGNQRRTTYAYRIVITNLRSQEVNLKLIEQLPVSRSEQIKVRLTRTFPQIQLGEMGILEWKFTLSVGMQTEIYYQFVVEHLPELTLVGLDI